MSTITTIKWTKPWSVTKEQLFAAQYPLLAEIILNPVIVPYRDKEEERMKYETSLHTRMSVYGR